MGLLGLGVPVAHATPLDFGTHDREVAPPTHLPAPPFGGRFYAAALVGRSLRFQNPYRLATPLGATPESLSLTAPYLDLALGGTLGRPTRLEHGAVVHLSLALAGVPQQVITPSYALRWRWHPRWAVSGRAGVGTVLAPDVSAGLEGGLGGVWYFTAGAGIAAEVVGAVYYGAATYEREVTSIPLLGFAFGFALDYEVWP